jgi:hypothetical protein
MVDAGFIVGTTLGTKEGLALFPDYEPAQFSTTGSGTGFVPSVTSYLQQYNLNTVTFVNGGSNYNFNGDFGTNYSWHSLNGDGGSATARQSTTTTRIATNTNAETGAPANTFGTIVFDILDYTNTNKFKTTRALAGVDINGLVASNGGVVELVGGNWRSTSAITSITITADSPNYVQYTTFSLYGIR